MFEFGRLIRRKAAAKENAVVLTPPQLEALHVISCAQEPLMRDVAKALYVKAPSATALIDELVARGLLIRRANPEDRREVRLRLTKEGRRVLGSLIVRKEKVIAEILGVLSAKDRAQFMRIIAIIVNAHKS